VVEAVPAAGGDTPTLWTNANICDPKLWQEFGSGDVVAADFARRLERLCRMQHEALISDRAGDRARALAAFAAMEER